MQYLLYSFGFIFLGFFSFLNLEMKEQPLENSTITIAPPPPTECIGANGQLRMFYWNHLMGDPKWLISLTHDPFYPNSPDGMIFVEDLAMPTYFNENHGALIRGFILIPETGDYVFNVVGDDRTDFLFSMDADPANATLMAQTPAATGTSNHTKYPEQTSDTLTLTAGTYHYFELQNKEKTGNDYARVFWQTPSAFDGNWVLIDQTHLYDYTCETICNPFGTPCDDNNPDTVEDVEDGNCNCSGKTPTTNDCIGPRGQATVLYYDGLSGNKIINMDTAAIFPNQPTVARSLNILKSDYKRANSFGTWLRFYLSVPVTGDYIFNITGDDETILWMSSGESDDSADFTQIARVSNKSGVTEYDKYASQTSDPITLQSGQYYYMELKMKENSSADHFAIHWRTPWASNDNWKIIPSAYFYQYNCETACVPQGIACDDGDNNTLNDMYDDNCNCIGIPCLSEDCNGTESYSAYEVCNLTDKHSNQVDSWQSCTTTPNPNVERGNGHWIMYDLNDIYQIHDTHIWNYNKAGETGKGIKDVAIDMSVDGLSWRNVGISSWSEAPGTTDYEGFVGENYEGEPARYVLITALSNWDGGDCSGFSELKMSLSECPAQNTPCDDGNPNTYDDVYDANCTCRGILDPSLALDLLAFDAKWDKQNVLVEWKTQNEESGIYYEVQRALDGQNFEAIGLLNGKGGNAQKNHYQLLDTKGSQLANELFYRLRIIENAERERFSHIVVLQKADGFERLAFGAIQPNPFQESVQITWIVPQNNTNLQLNVYNNNGQLVKQLVHSHMNTGQYQIIWDGTDAGGKMVEAGIYYLQLTDGRQRIGRRVVKL